MDVIKGRVIKGENKGRLLGFPTANIKISEAISVETGIYAGYTKLNGKSYQSALYIRGDRILEAFILDFSGDLYDQEAEVTIHKKIRERLEFKNDQEAKRQIAKDVSYIQDYFKSFDTRESKEKPGHMKKYSATLRKWSPFLVLLAAMLWASDAPFRLHLTKELSSNFIVLAEHFVDVLFVLPILLFNLSGLKKLTYKEWLAILFIAIGGSALASISFTQAFHYLNPSVAILLQKLQPFIAIGLAGVFLKERFGRHFWLWTAIAIFGAYLISFPTLIPKTYADEAFNFNLIGISLALVAAFFWGASTVFGKYVLNKTNFKVMTSLRFIVAFIFLIFLNIAQNSFPKFSSITKTDLLFIFIIAITSGVISMFIYYQGLEYTRASVATIAELGFPIAAILVNWLFISGALSLVQLLGVLIILGAVFGLTKHINKPEIILQK